MTEVGSDDLRDFLDSLSYSLTKNSQSLRSFDFVGLEICRRKLEEHLRLLIAISTFFQNRTGGNETAVNSDLLELVRELTDYLTEVINSDGVEIASRERQHRNEERTLACSESTGARPAYLHSFQGTD